MIWPYDARLISSHIRTLHLYDMALWREVYLFTHKDTSPLWYGPVTRGHLVTKLNIDNILKQTIWLVSSIYLFMATDFFLWACAMYSKGIYRFKCLGNWHFRNTWKVQTCIPEMILIPWHVSKMLWYWIKVHVCKFGSTCHVQALRFEMTVQKLLTFMKAL